MTQQRHSELHLIAIFDSGGDTRTAIDRSNVNADSLDASGIEMRILSLIPINLTPEN